MANKPIQTILNNEQKEIFNQFKGDKSTYQALRDLVDTLPSYNQEEKKEMKNMLEKEAEKEDTLLTLLNRLKD